MIAEPGTALQIAGPIAGVHVPNADQVGRPRESEQALPERGAFRGNARVNLREGGGGLKSSAYALNYDTWQVGDGQEFSSHLLKAGDRLESCPILQ
jgi:hypothetical protein